jgi:primosomal protein N' (replication factor Y) (superfamily II helicase)
VAAPRLFRLKAEVAPAPSGPIAQSRPVAKVRVDTGVFHLDQLYEYTVPEKLSDAAIVGVRVQLPFAGRETEGIITSRVAHPDRVGGLKPITKVLSPHAVATGSTLKLFERAAQFYCCNPWDLIRSAIPPRVASVDKSFPIVVAPPASNGAAATPIFHSFAPYKPAHLQMVELVRAANKNGSVLIIAPDENDVEQLVAALSAAFEKVLTLTSSLNREIRYQNYLQAQRPSSSIVVGTRSAVFAPVGDLKTLIIYKESSIDHYEIRSPGWNTSTIAQMRSENEGISLIYTGFSPSLNVAYQVDQKKIKYISRRVHVDVQAYYPSEGALLPGRIFSEIKKALNHGAVLFLAPRKGYGNALLCSHCRNVAYCDCGGRLSVASKLEAPTCVHCGVSHSPWKCRFCGRDKQYLAGRGIDRAAEEISRAFPGYPVVISAGDVIKSSVEAKPSLVLSTPGAQPIIPGGYQAVVILDAMRFFSHTDINGQERARELIFETASLIQEKGRVLLVLDEVHPIVASVARWNVAPLLKRELGEREELALPPKVASAVLVMEALTAPQIASGLNKALAEGRIPSSTRIYGPTILPKSQAKIVIHVSHEQWPELGKVLHELQRKRSISKKDLLTLRIDPYSL